MWKRRRQRGHRWQHNMAHAVLCWITKAAYTHWEYLILMPFLRRHRLRESASALRCTPVDCLFDLQRVLHYLTTLVEWQWGGNRSAGPKKKKKKACFCGTLPQVPYGGFWDRIRAFYLINWKYTQHQIICQNDGRKPRNSSLYHFVALLVELWSRVHVHCYGVGSTFQARRICVGLRHFHVCVCVCVCVRVCARARARAGGRAGRRVCKLTRQNLNSSCFTV